MKQYRNFNEFWSEKSRKNLKEINKLGEILGSIWPVAQNEEENLAKRVLKWHHLEGQKRGSNKVKPRANEGMPCTHDIFTAPSSHALYKKPMQVAEKGSDVKTYGSKENDT